MPFTRESKRDKRIAQACKNCRRKKTRCPGEKPMCSICTRLKQHCEYMDMGNREIPRLTNLGRRDPGVLEARLAELEERVNLIFEGTERTSVEVGDSGHRHHHTFTIADEDRPSSQNLSRGRTRSRSSLHSSTPHTRPAADTINRALDLFFAHCHRQPLWLFRDRESLTVANCSEEILYPVLALASCLTPIEAPLAQIPSFKECCDIARTIVMTHITKSIVAFPTLQSLCLLAFASFVETNISLCQWYTSTAKSLVRCSGLDLETRNSANTSREEQRRLFWSLFHLEQLCGFTPRSPALDNIGNPVYSTPVMKRRITNLKCPHFPSEAYNESEAPAPGIWAHTIRLYAVWGDLRDYIDRYASGDIQTPWSPKSDYSRINARMIDFETSFMDFYRYPKSKFWERSIEEISTKRQFWLPWMSVQLTYHALHAVLNHPFLRAVTNSMSRFGQNVFWRTSSDLAFLHGSRIAQILEICAERQLEASDPFLAHHAAVAASLQLYYSHAADEKIRRAAAANLATCRTFLRKLAAHWPLCRSIEGMLDELITLSQSSKITNDQTTRKVGLNTSLMWKILDISSSDSSNHSCELFHPSLSTISAARAIDGDDTTVENIEDPEAVLASDTVESYTQPVDWFDAVTSPADLRNPTTATPRLQQALSEQVDDSSTIRQNWDASNSAMPTISSETFIDMSDYQSVYLHDQGGDMFEWWNCGTL